MDVVADAAEHAITAPDDIQQGVARRRAPAKHLGGPKKNRTCGVASVVLRFPPKLRKNENGGKRKLKWGTSTGGGPA